jgi:hypothetical protein
MIVYYILQYRDGPKSWKNLRSGRRFPTAEAAMTYAAELDQDGDVRNMRAKRMGG